MPLFPYANGLAGAFLLVVLALMACFSDTRIAVIVGPLWIALVTLVYFLTKRQRASAVLQNQPARS